VSTDRTSKLRPYIVRGTALLLILAAFLLARPAGPGEAEQQRIAESYRFTALPIDLPPDLPMQQTRQVHPDYERIQAWISSVGAGVALTDLDGDGLSNDLCYVDPRVDRAIVAAAPTDPQRRYPAFALDLQGLYDDDSVAPMGCLPVDANTDGRMDLVVYYWGRTPTLHLAAGGEMTAENFRAQELLPGLEERWNTNAAVTADFDGDGRLDLLFGNYFPDGSPVLDADGEGEVTMQHSMSRAYNAGTNRLLLGTGDDEALFRDASDALDEEMSNGWALALGAADLDGDLLPEVYIANDFGPDRLLHNRSTPGEPRFAVVTGERTLTTPRSKVLGRDSFKGMGIDFGDINRDGHLDMVVSNITEEYALQESNFVWTSTGSPGDLAEGRAPFVDRSEDYGLARSGWGWDARMADLDNDGHTEVVQAVGFVAGEVNRWPEIQELALSNDELLAHPESWPALGPGTDLSGDGGVKFFARDGGEGVFAEVSDLVGLGETTVSRGIALGDADGDGRLDIAVANQWAAPVFYRNDSPDPGSFLTLRLVRPAGHGTTPAVGATARVDVPGQHPRIGHVDGGSGHSGKRGHEIHLGLGDHPADTPLDVTVAWRDDRGRTHEETVRLTPGSHTILLTETAATVPSETGSDS